MGVPWSTLLVALVLALTHRVTCQQFGFPSSVNYSPSCGVEEGDNWSVQGFVTISQKELRVYAPIVLFRATTELCSIDLTKCGVSNSNSIDICYCSNKVGDLHSIYVRRIARKSEAGETLQASMYARDPNNPSSKTIRIGKLPQVYDAPRAYYQVNSEPEQTLHLNRALDIRTRETEITLKFCVDNLLSRYNLGLKVDDVQRTSLDLNCVSLKQTLAPSRSTPHEVTLSFQESAGCRRSEVFKGTLTYGDQKSDEPERSNAKYPDLDLELFYGIMLACIFGIVLVLAVILLICLFRTTKKTNLNAENNLGSSTLEFTSL